MNVKRWTGIGLAAACAMLMLTSVGCSAYGRTFPTRLRSGPVTRHLDTYPGSQVGWRTQGPRTTKLGALRKNPAPEMIGVGVTIDQRNNAVARAKNTTMRQLIDDWDTFWLLREPSRLSLYPIP